MDGPTAAERVLARCDTSSGCWIFTGAKQQRGGYGVVKLGPGLGTDRSHRVVYKALVGPIPEGLTLDHLCGQPACCNPEHLEPVTRAENTRRQIALRGNQGGRPYLARTHCPKGHPLDGIAARGEGRTKRTCLTCKREGLRRARGRANGKTVIGHDGAFEHNGQRYATWKGSNRPERDGSRYIARINSDTPGDWTIVAEGFGYLSEVREYIAKGELDGA